MKICLICGIEIKKKYKESITQFNNKKVCSKECSAKYRAKKLKGQTAWNKGTIGVMKKNSGTWKKGDSRLTGEKKKGHLEKLKIAAQKRSKSPEHKKRVHQENILKRAYGISLDEYTEMTKLQNGKCKICGNENGKKNLSVDHNHKTGEIRGLLCHKCNFGIGQFNDNIFLLKKAVEYLKEYDN